MAIFKNTMSQRLVAAIALLAPVAGVAGYGVPAHAQAAAAIAPKRGTVKAIAGNILTVATDDGSTIKLTVADGAKVQKLAADSTDLKTATDSTFAAIAVGDRVLAPVKAGDAADAFTSMRVILMKSSDIAQKNASDTAEWRKNGTAGIVASVDGNGAMTVTAGTKKVTVTTTGKTEFRRYFGDSVKFSDAKPGTLADIHAGDQIQARGVKSADGNTVAAEQVVSGSFKNLSGLITNIDLAAKTITLKDLASKKVMTVNVTANADIRKLPPQQAAMLAGGGAAGGGRRGGGGAAAAAPAGGDAPAGGARRGGAADLAQMIPRLPTGTLAELKNGDAVMVVASEPSPGASTVTAITLLSGVDPILRSNPEGGMSLSGWSVGGGGAE